MSDNGSGAPDTLYDSLIRRRDEFRARLGTARMVIHGEKVPVELNPMGLTRWYVHPDFDDVGTRAIMASVLEIPPGSSSGRQHTQGGRIHYVWEGSGYTEVDGVHHDWSQGDVIALPIKTDGVVHQHFNSDPERPAKLLCIEPNWTDPLGIDMGGGLEQIDECPEFQRRERPTA